MDRELVSDNVDVIIEMMEQEPNPKALGMHDNREYGKFLRANRETIIERIMGGYVKWARSKGYRVYDEVYFNCYLEIVCDEIQAEAGIKRFRHQYADVVN